MFRKKACSGSVRDLAHFPTQKILQKDTSAKTDNLITAVRQEDCEMFTFTQQVQNICSQGTSQPTTNFRVMMRELKKYVSRDQIQHHVKNQQAFARIAF